MPETDMDAVAESEAIAAEVSAMRQQEISGGIPMADEPLDAARVNTVAQQLAKLVTTMSGGQLDAPKFPKVSGRVDMVPPDIGATIIALSEFLAEQGVEAYQFDAPSMMGTNAGLDELLGLIEAMLSDRDLQAGMAREEPPEADDATEEPEV